MHPDLTQLLITDLGLNPQRVHPDAGLEEAGLDSLGVVELSVLLSERWGVVIPETELAAARSLADLDRLVTERRGTTVGEAP